MTSWEGCVGHSATSYEPNERNVILNLIRSTTVQIGQRKEGIKCPLKFPVPANLLSLGTLVCSQPVPVWNKDPVRLTMPCPCLLFTPTTLSSRQWSEIIRDNWGKRAVTLKANLTGEYSCASNCLVDEVCFHTKTAMNKKHLNEKLSFFTKQQKQPCDLLSQSIYLNLESHLWKWAWEDGITSLIMGSSFRASDWIDYFYDINKSLWCQRAEVKAPKISELSLVSQNR